MESLLSKMRGSDYEDLENDNEKVMGRLEWLNHLSLIFNLTASIPSLTPCSSSITTEAFLNTLIENLSRLPLIPYSNYRKTSSVRCLSFKEVFTLFENDFGKVMNWDYILEKVMNFAYPTPGHRRGERSESPGSIDLNELVYISKMSSSSVDYDYENEHKSQKLGDLRIPHTPPSIESPEIQGKSGKLTPSPRGSQDFFQNTRASLRVPEISDNARLIGVNNSEEKGFSAWAKQESASYERFSVGDNMHVNLSCRKISILSMKLPNTLVELNLSHNRLTRMPSLDDIDCLECLNLSWNLLTAVTGTRKLRGLKELYLAHNKISEVEALNYCENLVILDLSFNKVQYFQGISGLSSVKSLRVLDIEGNTITKQIGFKENLASMLPQVVELNSKNIGKYTKFDQNVSRDSKNKKNPFGGLKKSESFGGRDRK
ncbi:hypothetical protein SteCoe_12642 [Stentor coeruleus]|uniref:Uncharacterized protein n=1 Tax=Stentor coeruleus TaxID=5963 RepID=A0A1R2CAB1_9CILI|nr:hypothetical protein SteCoe_12642 [Stentor coeruleus]